MAENGNSTLIFQDNLSVPASRIKKSKREYRAPGKLTDSHLFWDFIHHLILYRSTMFWKLAVFPFSGKEHLT